MHRHDADQKTVGTVGRTAGVREAASSGVRRITIALATLLAAEANQLCVSNGVTPTGIQ
jgi:hypothetical protein